MLNKYPHTWPALSAEDGGCCLLMLTSSESLRLGGFESVPCHLEIAFGVGWPLRLGSGAVLGCQYEGLHIVYYMYGRNKGSRCETRESKTIRTRRTPVPSFSRGGNWGLEQGGDLTKVIQPVRSKTEAWIHIFSCLPGPELCHHVTSSPYLPLPTVVI